MKKYYIILFLLSINIYAKSTNIQLDSIKYAVISMLAKEERCLSMSEFSNLDDFSNQQIRNLKTDKPIDSYAEGLYVFWPLSEHSYNHLLLIEKDSFQIINMRKPLEENLSLFINFLKRNNYTKDDIFFYLEQFIYLAELNRHNGRIWN